MSSFFIGGDSAREPVIDRTRFDMKPSFRNPHPLARVLCLLCACCLLAGCQTTEQENQWKVQEADRAVNKETGGELSPALKAANTAAGFLSSGAAFQGSF
jgi:ABC-type uncharacterized transport system auxiliary subunit